MTAATSATAAPSRIKAAFDEARAEGRLMLMPYTTAGFPDLATSEDVIVNLVAGGAACGLAGGEVSGVRMTVS